MRTAVERATFLLVIFAIGLAYFMGLRDRKTAEATMSSKGPRSLHRKRTRVRALRPRRPWKAVFAPSSQPTPLSDAVPMRPVFDLGLFTPPLKALRSQQNRSL